MRDLTWKRRKSPWGGLRAGIIHLRRAIELSPAYADAHYNLGLALADSGDFDEATAELLKAVKIKPIDPKCRYNLGRVLRQAGDLRGAMREFQTAVKLNPAYIEAQ